MAVAPGETSPIAHSATRPHVLAPSSADSTAEEERRASRREIQSAATSESAAPAAITTGSAPTEKLVRNRASRAALPATWCAIIAADVNAAAYVPATLLGETSAMRRRDCSARCAGARK